MDTRRLRSIMARYGAAGTLFVGVYLLAHHAWRRRYVQGALAIVVPLVLTMIIWSAHRYRAAAPEQEPIPFRAHADNQAAPTEPPSAPSPRPTAFPDRRIAFPPIRLAGHSNPIIVELIGKANHEVDDRPCFDLTANFVITTDNKRTVRASIPLENEVGLLWFSASLRRHRSSGQYLLVVDSNGGQHDHTQVYYLDPKRLRPIRTLDDMGVLYGDSDRVDRGILVEHTFAHYAGLSTSSHANVHRTLRYRPDLHKFTRGGYYWDR